LDNWNNRVGDADAEALFAEGLVKLKAVLEAAEAAV
jgi:hypothetical protein